MAFNLSLDNWMYGMFWWMAIGEEFFVGGEVTEAVREVHLLVWFLLDGIVVFSHAK